MRTYLQHQIIGENLQKGFQAPVSLVQASELFHGQIANLSCSLSTDMVLGGIDLTLSAITLETRHNDLKGDQPPFDGYFLSGWLPQKVTSDFLIMPRRHMTAAFRVSPNALKQAGWSPLLTSDPEFDVIFHTLSQNREDTRPYLTQDMRLGLLLFQTAMAAPVSIAARGERLYVAFEGDYQIFPNPKPHATSDLHQGQLQFQQLEEFLAALADAVSRQMALPQEVVATSF